MATGLSSKELGTHLTGRYQQIELYPFSFLEYLKLKGTDIHSLDHFNTDDKVVLKAAFNEYFKLGGFPAFLKSKNTEYLKSLYESVLYRDVMLRNGITNEQEILELMFFVTSNTSKLISYINLNWCMICCLTQLGKRLKSLDKKKVKRWG